MKNIVVIGGGFFGLYLSEYMALKGHHVDLFEKEAGFMRRASYVNQARIHQGYHYPRSILTALRSRISYPRFVREFKDCVYDQFEKYYLIGRILSKVTAKQFEQFCHRIGAPCTAAPDKITRLIDPHYIEACFATEECAFDAKKLRDIMETRAKAAGVTFHFEATVLKVEKAEDRCKVSFSKQDTLNILSADHVFNTTYADLNQVNMASGLDPISLKYELTEMCLVDVPEELKSCGITVMCGPFFSVMPFPSTPFHSFSHVRYTPQRTWYSGDDRCGPLKPFLLDKDAPPASAWCAMQHDAVRYMPILAGCKYKKSLWDVKTTMPRSEKDDSRPILFKQNYGIKGYHCIMSGKIDNVYDVVDAIEARELLSQ